MGLVLYDIFWSHFCEKARWCLDFKRLPHRVQRVNPFTRREVTDLGARGDVPVLRDGGKVIEASAAIAAYLEESCPDPPLLPRDAAGRAEVLGLEKKCDEELGLDTRRVGYQVALENPALMEGTLLWSRAPKRWLNGPLRRVLEPRLRRKFTIFPQEIQRIRDLLRAFLPVLQELDVAPGFLSGRTLTHAHIDSSFVCHPLELVPVIV